MNPIPLLYPVLMSGIDLSIMPLLKAKYLGSIDGLWILPLTMVLYSIQPLLFFFGLSLHSMGILNILWNAISSILIAISGVYFFNEKITSLNALGITLCVAGIIILGL
jgi:multidrug transporter EmrE-like cation transporter